MDEEAENKSDINNAVQAGIQSGSWPSHFILQVDYLLDPHMFNFIWQLLCIL